ncbi:hypothetical protein AQ490_00175 [Wenjunlia vitaminophila]|uniref:Aminotransferase class I/classII large domain-containing protein n=1 Tax=Wenjunlia vitaminophila TaxID=76728 RepID=A0A0T6LZN4_WENVI|nr:hypothetical protein AQ490_00175 [Wenjunlia vitaminophila]
MDSAEPGLPVHPELAARLGAATHRNARGAAPGSAGVRTAAAGYFHRRGLPTGPEQVVCAAGGGPLLLLVLSASPGDLVLPRPGRRRYPAQARLLGRRLVSVPTPAECGGVPDPFALLESVRRFRENGGDPRILVLTVPDDPTGTLPPPELLHEVCEVARDLDLLVVSDETLRDLAHHPTATAMAVSPAEILPERTVVVTGPGASLALSGWRFGVARFPSGPIGDPLLRRVLDRAAVLEAVAPAPVQDAVAWALSEPAVLDAHLAACVRLHAAVVAETRALLRRAGALCRPAQAGYQLYPDLGPVADHLARRSVSDSASLERHLLDRFGVAVSGGHRFGDDPLALRFRVTTGALYGTSTEQRWLALRAEDPLRLTHVSEALTALGLLFTELTN